MKILRVLLLLLGVFLTCSEAFMTTLDFKRTTLTRCYDFKRESQVAPKLVNGQELPLPSGLETFISLIERYETKYPSRKPENIIFDLLMSFRCDNIGGQPPDSMYTVNRETVLYTDKLSQVFFRVGTTGYAFQPDDFTQDEQCALHFMLSHTVNQTLKGEMNEERITVNNKEFARRPREQGLVSLSSKTKHAFALNKVLMGLLAGLKGESTVNAMDTYREAMKQEPPEELQNVKVNPLYAVTIADVISGTILDRLKNNDQPCILGNGLWNDAVCTTEYQLNENIQCSASASYSLLRGAIDGIILGKKIKKQSELNKNLKLSQILRAYYGPYGFPGDTELTWCRRKTGFSNLRSEMIEEVYNYDQLFRALSGSVEGDSEVRNSVMAAISVIESFDDIFKEASDEASMDCATVDTTPGRSCETPSDVFAILDYGGTENLRNLQFEVIGNLSVGFDIRESWSSMGVYTNQKPQQGILLDTIVNASRISGCPTCFAKNYFWRGSREGEVEVMKDLNNTLGAFTEEYDNDDSSANPDNAGSPAKVILYFNYGSPRSDWELQRALSVIRWYYRETTILAVGSKKESLEMFTENSDRDVFTDTGNAGNLANKIRDRLCKVPAEFQYKDCQQSSRGSGTARHEGYITYNKLQYWAMYPKYFLKSYAIKLKFKAEDGSQIRVCFTRWYPWIIEDKGQRADCKDSSGDEITFYVSNPCKGRDENNCDPFYFLIEGKKAPTTATSCDSIRCKATNQIRFEFSHDGIACNTGTFASISPVTLMLVLLVSLSFFFMHGR